MRRHARCVHARRTPAGTSGRLHAPLARGTCATSRALRGVHKTRGFSHLRAKHAARCGDHGSRAGRDRGDAAVDRDRPAPRRCAQRVLTPKKTVIRFRHNKTWPQQRVSATRSTTRVTTQSSARLVDTVDSGVVSPAKAPGPSMQATRRALRSGFFRESGNGWPANCIRHDAPSASSVGRGSDTRGRFSTGQ